MLTAIDLAYRLGAGSDPALAQKIVMELLRSRPEVALQAYVNVSTGIDADKFASVPAGTLGEIITFIRAGNKVGAIKAFRASGGGGLKEGLDFVNAIEQDLRDRDAALINA